MWYDPNDPNESHGSTADYSSSEAQLVNKGPDTITVPAGTFACTKYSVTMNNGGGMATETFWSSPQVPVPVKFTSTDNGKTIAYELTGWA